VAWLGGTAKKNQTEQTESKKQITRTEKEHAITPEPTT
jgi:hypothetical protein